MTNKAIASKLYSGKNTNISDATANPIKEATINDNRANFLW